MKKMNPQGIEVFVIEKNSQDYISLTDMARYKDKERTDYIIQNWLRSWSTIVFLGTWEHIHNPSFKHIEFDGFKTEAGSNSFSLTPKRWIESTNAKGLINKSGRHGGGTFAHKDIAFEFASWISPEFKLYLIKEFQRLKDEESQHLALGWDAKRMLTKINYRIHTDAIQEKLIPPELSKEQKNQIYATEADVLNVALFGQTAKEWRDKNPKEVGNIRDQADVTQLVCLANLESLNAEFIRMELSQKDRLTKLNQSAIVQMRSLVGNPSIKHLESKITRQ